GFTALCNLKGKDIDDAIINNINLVENNSKIVLVKAIGERRIKSGFDILLQTAKSENIHLRIASYESLGIISDPDQLNDLLKVFLSIENASELKKMENTLAKTALKNEKINERAVMFLDVLDRTKDFKQEMSLIRILGATGDKNAYSKIKEYLFDKNPEVKKVAIQSLYNWPNLDPLGDMLNIITTEENQTHKTVALRGYINLLKTQQSEYDGNIIDKYESVLEYVNEDSEKLMILSGLSELVSLDAVDLALDYLNDSNVKEEAELALMKILNQVRWRNPNEAYDALEKMLESPTSEEIAVEVKTLMKRIVRN
ncbi:MAG: HEAT repeat domain-containing protein, partial [Melioribacteraceae bacterium]|nr:HEAT repeat domain-containing protein [Melioribacteraceae bacterium]